MLTVKQILVFKTEEAYTLFSADLLRVEELELDQLELDFGYTFTLEEFKKQFPLVHEKLAGTMVGLTFDIILVQ